MSVWEEQFYRELPGDESPAAWLAIKRFAGFGRLPKAASKRKRGPGEAEELNVLIVEDDVLVALHIEGLLRGWGHLHTAITTTREATIETIRQRSPALVLVDIRLGERDIGVELAREIIQTFGLPVVFVTGQTGAKIDEAIRSVGPVAIVMKPFTPEMLRRVVEEALARSPRG